jgi:hypothetical protein
MGRSLAVSYGHTVHRSDSGRAGASARRAHERRRTRRVDEVRARHPRIGGLLLALGAESAAERNWSRGAHAEELVGEALERRCRDEVAVLHDRRLPGSRANIDQIAIAPSGVWVIDTKRYAGRIEVRSPLIGPAQLRIAGRDKTKLVDALARYCSAVATVVHELGPAVRVHGAFCFVEGKLPLFGTRAINGYPLLHRRSLVKRLNRRGPLASEDILALASQLASRFPPA